MVGRVRGVAPQTEKREQWARLIARGVSNSEACRIVGINVRTGKRWRHGRKGVIKLEDWAEIRRLHMSEGMAIKAIARRLGLARNTVRAALAADEPPRYERPAGGSRADGFEPGIRALLAAFPDMPATVIGERIGWEHSSSVLRAKVAELRPLYRPAEPAFDDVALPVVDGVEGWWPAAAQAAVLADECLAAAGRRRNSTAPDSSRQPRHGLLVAAAPSLPSAETAHDARRGRELVRIVGARKATPAPARTPV